MDQTGKDPRNHIKKEKTRKKAPSYDMSVGNQNISSQDVQILIK